MSFHVNSTQTQSLISNDYLLMSSLVESSSVLQIIKDADERYCTLTLRLTLNTSPVFTYLVPYFLCGLKQACSFLPLNTLF